MIFNFWICTALKVRTGQYDFWFLNLYCPGSQIRAVCFFAHSKGGSIDSIYEVYKKYLRMQQELVGLYEDTETALNMTL